MKSLIAALLLTATAAQAAPVLTSAGVSPTAGANTLHSTLTLDAAYDLSLHLSAHSALSNDLSFTSITVSQGAISYLFTVPETWAGSGSNWDMAYDTTQLALGAGTWDIATVYNDTQPGNAERKFSSFQLSLGSPSLHQVSAVPEPHGVALMGIGLLALGWVSRRKGTASV